MLRQTEYLPSAYLLVLLLAVSRCVTVPETPILDATELRLPRLPWGISTPEVTAALVERGFRFAGRSAAGDLRFNGGELLGHDASLIARMHHDRLVKVVAFLEPGNSERTRSELDSIVRTLQRFYGPPSIEIDSDNREARPEAIQLAWLRRRPNGRPFGVLIRTTQGPTYRIDLESPRWPDVYSNRKEPDLQNALAMPYET